MTPPISMRNPEELLRHSSWVHALALSLVHDSSLAEDVVQETWLKALTRPPKNDRSFRSWLAAVTKNSVRLQHRSRSRRRRREEVFAPCERLASTEELVQIESERRRVVDAVLSLGEPYRRTVLLHFWRDLPLEVIAQKEGIPSSTVRNRLRRALIRLRAELEREGAEKARRTLSALVAFAPLSESAGVVAKTTSTVSVLGAFAMMTKTKLALTSTLVAAAVVGWTAFRTESKDVATPPPMDDGETALVHADLPSELDGETSPERVAVEPLEPSTAPSNIDEDPHEESDVYGFITDGEGVPLAHALIRVTSTDGDVVVRSEENGGFWLKGIPSGEQVIECSARGYQTTSVARKLGAESERIDFALEPEVRLGIRFSTQTGESLMLLLEKESSFLLRDTLFAIATEEPPGPRIDKVSPSDRFGRGVYQRHYKKSPEKLDGHLLCDKRPPFSVSAVLGDVVLASQTVDSEAEEVEFRLSKEELLALSATVKFRVVAAATGWPLERVSIVVANSESCVCGKRAGEAGLYTLSGEVFGKVGLWVRRRGYEPFFRYVYLDPGETEDLGTIAMDPSVAITGRVRAPQSETPPTWLHQFALDALEPNHQMPMQIVFDSTDENGEFKMDAWPGKNLVVARPKDRSFGLAATVVDVGEGAVHGVDLEIRPAVEVTLHPRFSSGTTVRVFDARGLPLWSQLVTGEPRTLALSAGTYAVEAWGTDGLLEESSFEVLDRAISVDIGS